MDQWTDPLHPRWERGLSLYPDPCIEVLDRRFKKYVIGNAAVERLWTGARWSEGPVWFGDAHCLLFSDIPNNRILRWDEANAQITTYRQPSQYSNGNTRDRQGRLVTCEHGTRRITRTEYDGSVTVLIENYEGKRLNAPNDVIVASDGAIWFTDPGYGILVNYEGYKADAELPAYVYRLDPETGKAVVVADDFAKPNGLCFSPDEQRLYIVDSGVTHDETAPSNIRVFDVVDKKKLRGGREFIDMKPGFADGVRCDRDGNLWSSSGWGEREKNGVFVLTPAGELIGRIHLPEACANLCFGGRSKNRLFMASSQSLYSVYVEAQGAQMP